VNLIRVILAAAGSSPAVPITGVESQVDVQINTPTAIELVNFFAVYENGMILVKWTTAHEIDTFGFNIYRSQSENFADAGPINAELIPGKGTSGGDYVFADITVAPNATYRYWLIEVDTTGSTHSYGPAQGTAAASATLDGTGGIFLPLINR
ncbi:MAG: hypothetical protein KAX65_11275, partial [Caldilineaceae bacterium]|nr:hypothetical protein [Caldilineaceae bacterium]